MIFFDNQMMLDDAKKIYSHPTLWTDRDVRMLDEGQRDQQSMMLSEKNKREGKNTSLRHGHCSDYGELSSREKRYEKGN